MSNILVATLQVIRVPVALGLIGYLPGAMLVLWVFPPQSLHRVERFYLSTLASLCLAALTAYALAHSNEGLTPQNLFLWLSVLTVVFFAAAGLRWNYHSQKSIWPRPMQAWLSRRRLLSGLALAIVAVVAFAVNYEPANYGVTEFYLAPQNYQAAGVQYTRRDNALILPVEVVNHENRTATYRFEALLDENPRSLTARPTLMDGQRWASELVIPLSSDASVNRIDILLYIDHDDPAGREGAEQAEPIARLRLWLQDESTEESE